MEKKPAANADSQDASLPYLQRSGVGSWARRQREHDRLYSKSSSTGRDAKCKTHADSGSGQTESFSRVRAVVNLDSLRTSNSSFSMNLASKMIGVW